MNLKSYFTPDALFNVNSAYISPREKLVLITGAVLVLLAVVAKIAKVLAPSPADSKYRQKFYKWFLSLGLLQLFWYGCRYENVRFFDTHFLLYIIWLIGLVWLVKLLAAMIKNYPTEKQTWEKEQIKLKYLPK